MLGKNKLNRFQELAVALDSDEVLDSLGLMRKSDESSSIWPLVGGIGLGLLCGVAIGFAFAPKRGEEFRGDIGNKLKNRDFKGLADTARSSFGSSTSTTAESANPTMPGRSNPVI